ncbi:MAG TPA: tRNA uridine-5-carboxymethylaminomethyl(34) synthesis GTPase MnmE, partial [Usitatibacter sp.]|nr:tRNA uridine-5-carboxymethylaminomethyl(34) synthesis GTPase MnmE [Usitatibacter sp.]
HVVNKIDLTGGAAGIASEGGDTTLRLSAKTGSGVEGLRAWLLQVAGWKPHGEGLFMARERHLQALREACSHLHAAASTVSYELVAEELRLAQDSLAQITGEVSSDDLLGAIFSRFCIGK